MLLFAETITPRLQYIARFTGVELFNEPITITNDAEKFIAAPAPKICYHPTNLATDAFHIQPVDLLFEHDIKTMDITCSEVEGKIIFFQSNGHFPFDIFAASFYLLSRYEEYLPHQKDAYGRYAYTNAIAYKNDFLDKPLINYWMVWLKKSLKQYHSALMFNYPEFKFIPTYDIDLAWSFKQKGWFRTVGAMIRYLYKGQWKLFKQRWAVINNKQSDPFDTYEWMDALHLYCKLKPYYFFLVAEKQQGYDKNIHPSKKPLQQLIAYQSQKGTVGIHPSWQSGDTPKLLKTELGWLEFICDAPIKHSRQHYIRLHLPDTYRRLLEAGIEKDFSMGYGSVNGFRASVASSFYWFDLQKNESTSLLLFPFCFMDANAMHEEHLTPKQALDQLMHFYQQIKQVNGLMITIWHNQYFGTDPQYKGWKEVYEVFLKDEVYWDVLK